MSSQKIMNIKTIQKVLQEKLIEQQEILQSAIEDAETIRKPHCRDLWEIAEETERAVIIDSTLQNTQNNINNIKSALIKIDNKEYGYCKLCGDDIVAERLNVVPESSHCQSCQTQR